MTAVLTMQAVVDESGTATVGRLPGAANPKLTALALVNIIMALAGGQRRGRIRVSVDESTEVAASGTITMVVADGTAGDRIHIGDFFVEAVASGADATLGQYDLDGGTNNACATSVAAAINGKTGLNKLVSALAASDVVTVTAKTKGKTGNGILLRKTLTTGTHAALSGSALSGGVDAAKTRSVTNTITHASLADGHTFVVGGVTLTWRSSPSGESEVQIGADAAADAVNLAAKVNAHSKLQGLVVASADSGVATLTLVFGGRIGELVALSATAGGQTLSRTNFGPEDALAYVDGGGDYALGAAA